MEKIKEFDFGTFDCIEDLASKYLSIYAKGDSNYTTFDIDDFVEFSLGVQLLFAKPSMLNGDVAVGAFGKSANILSFYDKGSFELNTIVIDSDIAADDESLYRWILANAAANYVLYENSLKDFIDCTDGAVLHLNKSYCLDLRYDCLHINNHKQYANMLAVAFLMPVSEVMKFFDKKGSCFFGVTSLIQELSDYFCVPEYVAAFRLLSIFDRYEVDLL